MACYLHPSRPRASWAVTGAASCCDLVQPFLIQDRLSYQKVRFISLKKAGGGGGESIFCFSSCRGQLECIVLSTQTLNSTWLGEGEAGSLPGLSGTRGLNQSNAENSWAGGFLVSGQAPCTNHLDNLIWVSFILKWEQETHQWQNSIVQAFFSLNLCFCRLYRCVKLYIVVSPHHHCLLMSSPVFAYC